MLKQLGDSYLGMGILIKDLLAELAIEDRRLLMYAFNNEQSHFIEVGDGILGVYIQGIPGIEIIEQAGEWSYGKRNG